MSNFEEVLKNFNEHTSHLSTNREMRLWIRNNPELTRLMLRQFVELTLEALEKEKEQKYI